MPKHRPKVAIFSPALGAVSGVSTHARLLIESNLARDFELAHFQVGSEGRAEGATVKAVRIALAPLRLAWMLLRERPDLVHLNSSMDARAYWRDLAHLYVAKAFGVPVLNQVHGGAMPARMFAARPMLAQLLRRSLASSDAIAVLSREEEAAYRAFCPAARVVRIPNAIDCAGVAAARWPARPGQPLRLVYIGRLIREKGLFEMLEAVAALHQRGRSLQLEIAGSGAAESELIRRVDSLGLQRQVRFHGPVFGAAKNRLWQDSDVMLLPTYHPEGLPYSLLEAMAAGTPAITCPVAAIPDVMQDGVHGLFVAPRDVDGLARAIARLDDDRALLTRMSHASRIQVTANFSVERLAHDFNALYRSLLGVAA